MAAKHLFTFWDDGRIFDRRRDLARWDRVEHWQQQQLDHPWLN
jgi:hypothetical protein